jgi:hypothetical protein
MASGHTRRTNRTNIWGTDQHHISVNKTLANEAPSTHGTSPKCLPDAGHDSYQRQS